jgi:hypothetical protein
LLRQKLGGCAAQPRVQELGLDLHVPLAGGGQEAQNRTPGSAAAESVVRWIPNSELCPQWRARQNAHEEWPPAEI